MPVSRWFRRFSRTRLASPVRLLLWVLRGRDWVYRGAWNRSDASGWETEAMATAKAAELPVLRSMLAGARPPLFSLKASDHLDDDLPDHNTNLCFAYVIARASSARRRIRMLDWGGGIGQHHELAKALLPEIRFDYHCFDVPAVAAEGDRSNPEVTFHSDGACLEDKYDLVVASGSLQYSEDWRQTLKALANATSDFLYIARIPVVEKAKSFVVVQNAKRFGYPTPWQGWFFNRFEFLEVLAETDLCLDREFLIDEQPFVPGAPEQAVYRAFRFTRKPPDHRP
jgi:putative methyltransferase (TIGR04325 family)